MPSGISPIASPSASRYLRWTERASVSTCAQPRQGVANHGSAAMTHVQRPGRVGRDIFDVDALVPARGRNAVSVALGQDRLELVAPRIGLQADIDEPRAGDFHRGYGRKC